MVALNGWRVYGSVHGPRNVETAQKIVRTNTKRGRQRTTALTPPFMHVGRLHLLTDTNLQQRYSHAQLARFASDGGADAVQFRQKQGSVRDKLAMLTKAAAVCRDSVVQFIVDDHLDLALAVGADGVHLGHEDLPIEMARTIVDLHDGPTQLIGATCTNVEQAHEAVREGADYIGFGPVFPTSSKKDPAPVKGLDGLAEVCRSAPIPVIAIGGITVERVQSVLEAGAYGVAVMSAVTMADNPEKATRKFRNEIDSVLAA